MSMSKNNQPVTFYERQQIEYYLKLKFSKRNIGGRIKRDHSIVVREINRHIHPRFGYRSDLAQAQADRLAKKTNKRKLDKDYWLLRHVEKQLEAGLSPQQIAGRLKECPPKDLQNRTISHEAIYQYIYETVYGQHFYHYLRRTKPTRQRQGGRKKQGKTHILERVSIHERPEEIALKARYGDWERDLMEFKKRKEYLAVQYERKSMLIRLRKVANKTAEESLRAIFQSIDSLPLTLFKSMTFDNGGENACHLQLKREFGLATYFCDTYAAWQKGGVENINGLIRQYLPKGADLSKLTNEDIYLIQEKLNNRPRKSLNYLTPNEIINREFSLRGGALNS
jgi:IS30 family transposase